MVEQQLFAVPSPSTVENNSKNSDVGYCDDVKNTPEEKFESSEKLSFVEDHFSVPSANEFTDSNQEYE